MTYRINGFEQIKNFYSWVFENQGMVKPVHVSLYLFLLNQNNRINWVEWFKLPYDLGMTGSCIGSRNTYYKCLDDLVEWKLIEYKKGVNNHKTPEIKLCLLKNEHLVPNVESCMLKSEHQPILLSEHLPIHIYKLVTNNNLKQKKEKEKKEKKVPEEIHPIQNYINRKLPKLANLENLTFEEGELILKEYPNRFSIQKVLMQIEQEVDIIRNYSPNESISTVLSYYLKIFYSNSEPKANSITPQIEPPQFEEGQDPDDPYDDRNYRQRKGEGIAEFIERRDNLRYRYDHPIDYTEVTIDLEKIPLCELNLHYADSIPDPDTEYEEIFNPEDMSKRTFYNIRKIRISQIPTPQNPKDVCWAFCRSEKGEVPFLHTQVDIAYLSSINSPKKAFSGVIATENGDKFDLIDHYTIFFPLQMIRKASVAQLQKWIDYNGDYVAPYHAILTSEMQNKLKQNATNN